MSSTASSWVLQSGAPWRDLPDHFGPCATCHNRFVRWRLGAHHRGTCRSPSCPDDRHLHCPQSTEAVHLQHSQTTSRFPVEHRVIARFRDIAARKAVCVHRWTRSTAGMYSRQNREVFLIISGKDRAETRVVSTCSEGRAFAVLSEVLSGEMIILKGGATKGTLSRVSAFCAICRHFAKAQ